MKVKVGITGGIGSGKTTVCTLLEVLGFPVYYSDTRANWLMDHDPALKQQIIAAFGELAYINGNLNKPFLAEIIFNDPQKKQEINNLVHPVVRLDFEKWVNDQSETIVFQESALLFETGNYQQMDFAVLVCADEMTKIERVMKRNGISRNDVEMRMKSQLTDDQKMPLADFIIRNDANVPVIPQVFQFIQQINC